MTTRMVAELEELRASILALLDDPPTPERFARLLGELLRCRDLVRDAEYDLVAAGRHQDRSAMPLRRALVCVEAVTRSALVDPGLAGVELLPALLGEAFRAETWRRGEAPAGAAADAG
ncbi:MAG: hypothetical protein U0869_25460 [Chloroflexota bacterium]